MPETTEKTDNLNIEGLHCMDCAANIEKTVAKINGVRLAKASFSSGNLKVTYSPTLVKFRELVSCVEKIGYRVRTEESPNIERTAIWKQLPFWLMICSGIALGAGLLLQWFKIDPILTPVGKGFTVSAFLFFCSIGLGASQFSRGSWAALRNLQFNMDLLMSIAIIGAILIGQYIEAASLAFLFSLAELLESYAIERARNSLRELMNLSPQKALVRSGGEEQLLNVNEVMVGAVLVVKPGEKIALDGIIKHGISSVDQSPITGESLPVHKKKGDPVYAGSLNNEGYLEAEVTQNSKNTLLARIIHLVEEAELNKAPVERFVEKFARYYTPIIVSTAVAVAVAPVVFAGADFHTWFIKALTLLVIACPCALVISTPVSVVSALTNASRNGVLIKGGLYLEQMAKVKVIAFDKTGTLTCGKLTVSDIIPIADDDKVRPLQIAATLEKQSQHPIAKAVVKAAGKLEVRNIEAFQSITGKGVSGKIDGVRYLVGQPALFNERQMSIPVEKLQNLRNQGKTTILVGTDEQLLAIIAVSDSIRPEAQETINRLRQSGKKVVMLTGDDQATAATIAKSSGIDEYYAGLLPEDKLQRIKELQKSDGPVAMIGDGVNDAPALAAADVGIAMGAIGSDTALETADIALMSENLFKLPYLIELSEKSSRVIKQNTFSAISIKLGLAFGVFPGFVSLVVAVLFGDMGASLGVIVNSLRLAYFKASK